MISYVLLGFPTIFLERLRFPGRIVVMIMMVIRMAMIKVVLVLVVVAVLLRVELPRVKRKEVVHAPIQKCQEVRSKNNKRVAC